MHGRDPTNPPPSRSSSEGNSPAALCSLSGFCRLGWVLAPEEDVRFVPSFVRLRFHPDAFIGSIDEVNEVSPLPPLPSYGGNEGACANTRAVRGASSRSRPGRVDNGGTSGGRPCVPHPRHEHSRGQGFLFSFRGKPRNT